MVGRGWAEVQGAGGLASRSSAEGACVSSQSSARDISSSACRQQFLQDNGSLCAIVA